MAPVVSLEQRVGDWPDLPLDEWKETYSTLHMWVQIVGKVRLVQTPLINHWWNVTLYVTSRGLTTSPMPYGDRTFQIDFDFIAHRLVISACEGGERILELAPRSVADFYAEFMQRLRELGIEVHISPIPQEVPDPVPFDQDFAHASYDAEYANRCWRILSQADRVMQTYRSSFVGKASPIHFFWGSFDLACTRFSGRPAPPHAGGGSLPDWIVREAYSHEEFSAGWWPGSGPIQYPAFYAYAYPEPAGFRGAAMRPPGAFYSTDLGEHILPYDQVRLAADPDTALLEFLQTTYDAAADLGGWDRQALERSAS